MQGFSFVTLVLDIMCGTQYNENAQHPGKGEGYGTGGDRLLDAAGAAARHAGAVRIRKEVLFSRKPRRLSTWMTAF